MSWNYRILKKTDPHGNVYYALHEMYYNPAGPTADPITFVAESPEEIVGSLEMALNDCRKHPVLEVRGE